MRYLSSLVFVVTVTASGLALASSSSSSTDTRSDGGKSVTSTSARGTVCTVFSPQGKIMCTRTLGETNHKAAIAKCVRMKC